MACQRDQLLMTGIFHQPSRGGRHRRANGAGSSRSVLGADLFWGGGAWVRGLVGAIPRAYTQMQTSFSVMGIKLMDRTVFNGLVSLLT
jgi:hypothetical protein